MRTSIPVWLFSLMVITAVAAIVLPHEPSAGTVPSPSPAQVFIPAHSHNDYYRDRPLYEALAVGTGSIEADVFPVNGTLMIAHDRHEIRSHRTIDALYLEPLLRRLHRLDAVYPGQPQEQPVLFVVDIKANWTESLHILEASLEPFAQWLTRIENGTLIQGKLMVIVSGMSPRKQIAADDNRLLFADGRLPDLEPGGYGAHVAPLVSDRWPDHFSWDGVGVMPKSEHRRLREMVKQANQRGQLLRLWATPDLPNAWEQLIEAGVHLVNTDRPLEFGVWYSQYLSSD